MSQLHNCKNLQVAHDVAFGDPGELTPREHEFVICIAEGLSSKEVARVMGISERTANFHADSAMDKLGARNRAHLVWIASRKGIIVPAGFATLGMLIFNLVVCGAFYFLLKLASNISVAIALSTNLIPSDNELRRNSVRTRVMRTVRVRTREQLANDLGVDGWLSFFIPTEKVEQLEGVA